MDHKETVYLPKTDFPMRAALSEREPAQVKAWEDEKVYQKRLEKNAKAEKFSGSHTDQEFWVTHAEGSGVGSIAIGSVGAVWDHVQNETAIAIA